MEMAVEQNETVGLTVDCVLIRRDGLESAIEDSAAPIHDRVGRVIGAVIVFHDVSVAREMSRKMTHSAQHDFVTNLPNRLLLNDRIAQSISLARRKNKPLAVLFWIWTASNTSTIRWDMPKATNCFSPLQTIAG